MEGSDSAHLDSLAGHLGKDPNRATQLQDEQCGDDGHDETCGSCGSCAPPEEGNPQGQCEKPPCEPDCTNKQCDPYGHDETCGSCGSCAPPEEGDPQGHVVKTTTASHNARAGSAAPTTVTGPVESAHPTNGAIPKTMCAEYMAVLGEINQILKAYPVFAISADIYKQINKLLSRPRTENILPLDRRLNYARAILEFLKIKIGIFNYYVRKIDQRMKELRKNKQADNALQVKVGIILFHAKRQFFVDSQAADSKVAIEKLKALYQALQQYRLQDILNIKEGVSISEDLRSALENLPAMPTLSEADMLTGQKLERSSTADALQEINLGQADIASEALKASAPAAEVDKPLVAEADGAIQAAADLSKVPEQFSAEEIPHEEPAIIEGAPKLAEGEENAPVPPVEPPEEAAGKEAAIQLPVVEIPEEAAAIVEAAPKEGAEKPDDAAPKPPEAAEIIPFPSKPEPSSQQPKMKEKSLRIFGGFWPRMRNYGKKMAAVAAGLATGVLSISDPSRQESGIAPSSVQTGQVRKVKPDEFRKDDGDLGMVASFPAYQTAEPVVIKAPQAPITVTAETIPPTAKTIPPTAETIPPTAETIPPTAETIPTTTKQISEEKEVRTPLTDLKSGQTVLYTPRARKGENPPQPRPYIFVGPSKDTPPGLILRDPRSGLEFAISASRAQEAVTIPEQNTAKQNFVVKNLDSGQDRIYISNSNGGIESILTEYLMKHKGLARGSALSWAKKMVVRAKDTPDLKKDPKDGKPVAVYENILHLHTINIGDSIVVEEITNADGSVEYKILFLDKQHPKNI